MAKKLVEEAIEVGLDAVQMNREAVILESADVLYHLAVVWAECGVAPADVFGEIDRRERSMASRKSCPSRRSPPRPAAFPLSPPAPQGLVTGDPRK